MHRGLHTKVITENTLLSFIKAMECGYTIELDIHILKDETIVVFHDYNLKRLTGVNKIIEKLTFPQLSKYKIKDKYQIPTLKQVMNIINGKVPLLIEIKTLEKNTNFFERIVDLLDNYQGLFAIQSIISGDSFDANAHCAAAHALDNVVIPHCLGLIAITLLCSASALRNALCLGKQWNCVFLPFIALKVEKYFSMNVILDLSA